MPKREENSEKQLAKAVGAAIAVRRKSRGLTQAQLAEQMDIEKETVSRLETGSISPTLHRLAQLASLLDCEMGDFLQPQAPELHQSALSLAGKLGSLSESQSLLLIDLFGRVSGAMQKLSAKDRKVVEKFLLDIR